MNVNLGATVHLNARDCTGSEDTRMSVIFFRVTAILSAKCMTLKSDELSNKRSNNALEDRDDFNNERENNSREDGEETMSHDKTSDNLSVWLLAVDAEVLSVSDGRKKI